MASKRSTGTRGQVPVEGDAAGGTQRPEVANTLYITSSNIGKVPEYNNLEDFGLYLERLEQYFIANFIEEDRKVAVLLTVIGSQTYKILRDLCDPDLPKNKSYEDLCSLLKKQFSPQISVFRKRIEFYESKQNSSESVNEWYAKIKNLAVHCSFGRLLEVEVLKDKFVTGLKKGKILDRLCEEDATKGLQELIEIAVKKEASIREHTTEEFKKSASNEEDATKGLQELIEIAVKKEASIREQTTEEFKKSASNGKGKKKEEKKQEKKQHQSKKELDAAEAALSAKLKSKDPFDSMPKGTFDMDDFKCCYNEDKSRSIPYFWEKFDPENYSIWYAEYKYPEELTKVLMSCNLITGMFQRLDKMRKQAFASVCLFGEDNDSTISGIWVWRGHELVFPLSPDWQIGYESYDWKKLDASSVRTKKLVEQYFSWSGTDKGERKFNQGKIFK